MEASNILFAILLVNPLIVRAEDFCDSFGPSDIHGVSSLTDCLIKAERSGRGSIVYFNKSNRTCRTWSQCRYAIETGRTSCTRHFRIEKGQEIVLMQTRAESKVDPYEILIKAATNSSFVEASKLTSIYPYKSPLIALQKKLPLEKVRLELHDDNDVRVAYITFSFQAGGRLEDPSAWFAKNRLVASSPWNINILKSYSYNYFAFRYRAAYLVREFHINTKYEGCPGDVGILAIAVKTYCTWERKTYLPSYIWSHHNGTAANYNFYGKEAFKLSLIGVIGTVEPRWFMRNHKSC